jgi:hypothetical protein
MNQNVSALKMIGVGVVALIALFMGFKLIAGLAAGLMGLAFKLLIPAAIVLGALYFIYRATGGDKSLPGTRKRLP